MALAQRMAAEEQSLVLRQTSAAWKASTGFGSFPGKVPLQGWPMPPDHDANELLATPIRYPPSAPTSSSMEPLLRGQGE
jgi:hypothetical protein